jgi:hypothetical protein
MIRSSLHCFACGDRRIERPACENESEKAARLYSPRHEILDNPLLLSYRNNSLFKNKYVGCDMYDAKCKVIPVHAMKPYRGSRGIAPLIRNFDARWR